MRVNSETLLFEDLTADEALALVTTAESILFGPGGVPDESLVEIWMKAGRFDDRQRLLMISTVFPARALLSAQRFFASQPTLDTLINQGDIAVHNAGPELVLIDFLPPGGPKQHGEGADLASAIRNLR